jgi:hypothetical protein
VFPVRYELDLLVKRNSVFKGLMSCKILLSVIRFFLRFSLSLMERLGRPSPVFTVQKLSMCTAG